jgi:SAM-dependent methyltransferase
MNVPIDDQQLLTNRTYLTRVQYRTDANLAARQSVYAYQVPKIDLASAVLDLARLTGTETVAEVGCGNGIYLAELTRRRHRGKVLGADLSHGMLTATRARAPAAGLVIGDAAALPLADAVADVTLAAHMLYHVPDRAGAAREFRRVTRDKGQLLVVLNGADHLVELGELVDAAAVDAGLPERVVGEEYRTYRAMTLDKGADLLGGVFGSVTVHDFAAELVLPDARPVADYVASMRTTQSMPDPAGFAAAVAARVPFAPDGTFRVRTHSGVLICS